MATPEPGDRMYLPCPRERKITPHRYEGPLTKYLDAEKYPDLYAKFKDKHLLTCLSCKSTFTHNQEELDKLDWTPKI